jgi:hypothetical protein
MFFDVYEKLKKSFKWCYPIKGNCCDVIIFLKDDSLVYGASTIVEGYDIDFQRKREQNCEEEPFEGFGNSLCVERERFNKYIRNHQEILTSWLRKEAVKRKILTSSPSIKNQESQTNLRNQSEF